MRHGKGWLAGVGCVVTAALLLALSGVLPSWADVRRSSENFFRLWVGGQVTVAPPVAQPPMVLGVNAQGQKVVGLDADTLDGNTSAVFEFFANKGVGNGYAPLDAAAEVTALYLQGAAADLGDVDIALDFGNTHVGRATSLTLDGTVTAPTFAGALTGNVTGNVTGSSGSCTGNAATATNADTLDGQHAAAFAVASHAVVTHSDWPVSGNVKAGYSAVSAATNTVGAGSATIDYAVPVGVWHFEARCAAYRTDGANVGQGGAFTQRGYASNIGGVASVSAGSGLNLTQWGIGTTAVVSSASGANLRLTVTGTVGVDIRWRCYVQWFFNDGS